MNVKDLKKQIKSALGIKKLISDNKPSENKEQEVNLVISSVIRQVANDEVKRKLIQKAEEATDKKFKFYRKGIRGQVGKGSRELANFLDMGFQLKSKGLWELTAEVVDNRWGKPSKFRFGVAVGIPSAGDIVFSDIPDPVVNFLISRREEEEVIFKNANALDDYLEDSGFVTDKVDGMEASVKLKGMFE